MTIIEGLVTEDGRLEVKDKINLPAGPVQLMIQPMSVALSNDPSWQRMQAIWDAQKARGHIPRSVEEVERERREMREEMDREVKELEKLQEECRQAREVNKLGSGEKE